MGALDPPFQLQDRKQNVASAAQSCLQTRFVCFLVVRCDVCLETPGMSGCQTETQRQRERQADRLAGRLTDGRTNIAQITSNHCNFSDPDSSDSD